MNIFYSSKYKLKKEKIEITKGKIITFYCFLHENGNVFFAHKNLFGFLVPKGLLAKPLKNQEK